MTGPVLYSDSGRQQKCSQSCSSLIIPGITSAQLLPPVETSLCCGSSGDHGPQPSKLVMRVRFPSPAPPPPWTPPPAPSPALTQMPRSGIQAHVLDADDLLTF